MKTPQNDPRSMWKGYIRIVIAMLIWGSVGVFGRWTGQPSTVIVFYRVITAFVVLGVWWLVSGRAGLDKLRAGWKWAVGSGLALGLNWFFFFTAVQKTTVANAVLSYYTSPIMVTILSAVLLRERVERRTVLALSVGFGGILVMMAGPGSGLTPDDLLGIGAGLSAAFFYALLTISGKWIDLPAHFLVLVQTGVSVLIFAPYVIHRPLPEWSAMVLLILIGVVHTALALTLYFEGVKAVKVQHVGILGYLDPLSAIGFALLFLGEVPGISAVAGGALILYSSYVILRK